MFYIMGYQAFGVGNIDVSRPIVDAGLRHLVSNTTRKSKNFINSHIG